MLEIPRLGSFAVVMAATGLLFSVCSTSEAAEKPATVQGVGKPNQFIVELRMIELDRKKMRRLGMDFVKRDDSDSEKVFESILPDIGEHAERSGIAASNSLLQFLHSLEQNSVIEVLAEPDLVVIQGQEATLSIGKTVEVPFQLDQIEGTEQLFVGTRVKLQVNLTDNDTADLKLDFEVRDLIDPPRAIPGRPGMNVCGIDRRLTVPLSETIIIPIGRRSRIAKKELVHGTSDSVECEHTQKVVEDKMAYVLVKTTLVDANGS